MYMFVYMNICYICVNINILLYYMVLTFGRYYLAASGSSIRRQAALLEFRGKNDSTHSSSW